MTHTWKECGNCEYRDEVPNAQKICPNCLTKPLYKTVSRNPSPGKEWRYKNKEVIR